MSSGGRSDHDWLDQPGYTRRFQPLLSRGYTVFAVIHSSGPRFNLQDFVSDVRRAVRFVRHRHRDYAIVPDQIGIAGASAGGYLALMIATTGDSGETSSADPVEREPSTVQAVACLFAPADWTNFGNDGMSIVDLLANSGSRDPTFEFHEFDEERGVYTSITDHKRTAELLKELSPVTHVSKDDPSALIIHGDADRNVPFQHGRLMVDAFKRVGVTAELITRTGKGHAWSGWEEEVASIADWFDRFLTK